MTAAESNWSNFRLATRQIAGGQDRRAFRVFLPLKTSSEPMSLNETIMMT